MHTNKYTYRVVCTILGIVAGLGLSRLFLNHNDFLNAKYIIYTSAGLGYIAGFFLDKRR
jgi:hypothetical protein